MKLLDVSNDRKSGQNLAGGTIRHVRRDDAHHKDRIGF